jgi:hypothetical protein
MSSARPRADSASSLSSSATSSVPAEDVPVEDFEEGTGNTGDVRQMFERRMSLGQRLREVRPRAGSMSSLAGQPSPTIVRGFWLDPSNPLKKRRDSISTMPLPEHVEASNNNPSAANLQRRASVSVPPSYDPLQERILKGDFYMD